MGTSSSQFHGLRSLRRGATSWVVPGADGGVEAVATDQLLSCSTWAVHGSVRRAETSTSTRPSRSPESVSAATGNHGHSEAKCATSHSPAPVDCCGRETRCCWGALVGGQPPPPGGAAPHGEPPLPP